MEEILSAKQEPRHPVCIYKAHACPPEDYGGLWNYAGLLKIIRNPRDEEYEQMIEWLDDNFNPEH